MTDAELAHQVDAIWDQINEISAKLSRLTDQQKEDVIALDRQISDLRYELESRLDDHERRISDLESRQRSY